MTQYSRLCIAALLLSCVASVALAEPVSLEAQKQQVVRGAMQLQPAADAEATLRRAPGAASLLELSLGEPADEAAVTLRLTEAPACTTFGLDGGRRIVVDLRNTINLHDGAVLEAKSHPLIATVHTSLYSIAPEFISRVELELKAPCDFKVDTREDRVRIQLTEKQVNRTAVLAGLDAESAYFVDFLYHSSWTAPAPVWNAPLPLQMPTAQDISVLSSQLASLGGKPLTVVKPAAEAPAGLVATPARPESRTDPVNARASRLAQELTAVADARVELGLAARFSDAAQADQEPAAPGEAAPPAAETPAAETPAPPGPRVEPAVPDPAANRSFTSVMRDLRGDATGDDESLPEVASAMEAMPMPSTSKNVAGASLPAYTGDPMYQPVDVDFRDAEISFVVGMLANLANINIIGSEDLSGVVTVDLRNVPLKQAMETTLSINGLGLINKKGIYYIVSYDEAMQSQRQTQMVVLNNAKAADIQKVLESVLQGDQDQAYVDIATHEAANTLVIRAPETKIAELVALAQQLDVSETVPPVVTSTIALNWANASEMLPLVQSALTKDLGQVAADPRGSKLIVTDQPVVVEQIRALLADLDSPVKQVFIDAMIVDVTLQDAAETGVDWIINALRNQSRSQAALGQNGRFIGDLQELNLDTNLGLGEKAGMLAFNVLSGNINWAGVVQAEVRNDDSHLVSRPQVVTTENKPATITISQEIPYIELTQTNAGGSQTSTSFKDIGTILTVTPQVTNDNHIMVDLDVKESNTGQVFNGIPIENKRSMRTSSTVASGHTILIGGLRKNNENASVRKVPVLGNIPVLNVLFKQNVKGESVNELLVFLTCSVIESDPVLTTYEQTKYDAGMAKQPVVNAEKEVLHDIVHPNEMRSAPWGKVEPENAIVK